MQNIEEKRRFVKTVSSFLALRLTGSARAELYERYVDHAPDSWIEEAYKQISEGDATQLAQSLPKLEQTDPKPEQTPPK